MTDLYTAISNFGFPIVVASYLLVRFEKKIEKLTEVIDNNNKATNQLVEAISHLTKVKKK